MPSRLGTVFDPKHDYGYRQKIYSRASRTATLSRKNTTVSPPSLNQLLLGQNQRWQGAMESIQESTGIPAPQVQQQYTYGANFNTDFNAQFDVQPTTMDRSRSNTTNEQHSKGKSFGAVKPKRTISKNLLNRIRPNHRHHHHHDTYGGRSVYDYNMPPSNLVRLFGETSLPGVRDIALSRSFLRRIFWICSFLFFGFLALKDISQLVSEYYTYPITVDVRLRDSRRLQFPAVTVCNLNIVRYSALCVANVSMIKDSMIPRDLREKLCGGQPSAAIKESIKDAVKEAVKEASAAAAAAAAAAALSSTPLASLALNLTTVTPQSVTQGTTAKPALSVATKTQPSTKTNPSTKHSPPMTSRTTTSRTTTVTPTESDTLDDINNYGVISKPNKPGGNETTRNTTTPEADNNNNNKSGAGPSLRTANESSSVFNVPITESSTVPQTTGTTVAPALKGSADVPNDISMPMQLDEDGKTDPSHKGRSKRRAKWASASKQQSWPLMTTSNNVSLTTIATTTTDSNQFDNTSHTLSTITATTTETPSMTASKQPRSVPDSVVPTPPPPYVMDNDIELTEREEKELQENLTNWLAVIYNSNEEIAKDLGHQFEDFVLRCTIRSTNCTHPQSFERFFTPTEGNCYTFKSQKLRKAYTDRIKDETSIAGVNYGLELVLNLEIAEYLTGTTQIGAIIMIQHPDEIGISASEAIFVAPQQSTYIGLKMVNISRLPKPYPEECIDHWPSALIGRLTQNASYSQQACLKICLQRTIHMRCKCQSAMLPQLELNSTLKICDTRRRNTRKCVEEVMFQAEEKVSTCKCPPRCQVINYDKTVSMTKWPTREDKMAFDRGKTNINFQNLAKVTVYFQTMTCQEVRQEKAYTTAKLFSALGGILGMYVGFSFLSLFEIIEVFIRRSWHFVSKRRGRFRSVVHTIRATFAFNTKPVHKEALAVPKAYDHKTELSDSFAGKVAVRRGSMVTGRYPITPRLNQPFQHGIV